MPQEIELKLAIDARDVPKLRRSSILRELSLKHIGPRSLVSIYYDTSSHSLRRNGIVLRVRKIGRKRVQGVKMNAAATSLFRRTELESPIRGNRPDLMQIADLDVRRLIQKHCASHDLARVFSTNVKRETWLLRLKRNHIECAIDRGEIASEGTMAPICEVELELKSGQPASIYQLAHLLNATVPLKIETKSKEARGYDLVKHVKLIAPKAESIIVNRDMSVRECFAAIAQPCIHHMLAAANFADNSDDPEGIHQLRVAIRRMRAAFSMFHGAMPEDYRPRLAGELRTFEHKLGAARDWDVLAEETIASMPGRLRRQQVTRHLVRIAQTKRAEGGKGAHAWLRDPRCTDILLRLASWVDSQFGSNASAAQAGKWQPTILARPAPEFAAEMMRAYQVKAQKLGRKVGKLDPAGLHRLRIRIKKLRYATEFSDGFWPNKQAERYLAALKDLQQALGAFHDIIVAEGLIAHFTAAERAGAKLSTAPINRWLTKYQRRLRKEAIDVWREFAKQKPFWEDR
jgi:inorganic triphosphatase YgiF